MDPDSLFSDFIFHAGSRQTNKQNVDECKETTWGAGFMMLFLSLNKSTDEERRGRVTYAIKLFEAIETGGD